MTGFIEGLTAGYEINLQNNTGISFTNLVSQPSCGCLKSSSIDGADWPEGSTIKARFSMLPTSGHYEQSCIISGVDDRGDRKEICVLRIVGSVDAPIEISRSSIMPTDLEAGALTIDVSFVPDVQLDWGAIRLSSNSQDLKIEVMPQSRQIKLIFEARKLEPQPLALQFPLEWKNGNYVYSIPLSVVSEILSVTPRSLVFRSDKDTESHRCSSKFIVKGNGVRLKQESFRCYLVDSAVPDKLIDLLESEESKLNVRMIGTSIAVLEVTFNPKRFDEGCRSLRIEFGNSVNRTVDFVIN
ncbi:MAG: hypothetical protein ACK5YR_00765 [Pirellula sp.]|jgi:hypothetical protein